MTATFETKHWPEEIRYVSEDKRLEVGFDNGVRFSYPAELLRVESPSAEVRGHGPGQGEHDAAPDAAASSGDDRTLPTQVAHLVPPGGSGGEA